MDGQKGTGIRNARWADPDYYSEKYAFEEGDIWIGRNPHNANFPIGHRDDKHIIVCAGAGSGKGRSFIVNNLALWQGSTITYDPKGELPDILAARRGDGDQYCDGLKQDVFVLDPFNRSTVDDRYRGYCDPVAMIDPNDEELSNTCYRLANSLVRKKESGQAQDWADKGIAFTALVVEHVVTYREFKDEERNIHTVYELLLRGNVAQAKAATDAFAAHAAARNANLKDGEQPIKPKIFDPFEVLLNDMEGNERASRFLGMEASALKREMERVPKYFTHVSGEAREGLRWLRSTGIERVLSGKGMNESRLFDPRRLKTDPNGVSLFIVLPVEDLKENEPWLQSLFVGIFAAIRAQKVKPKVPILTVLDEFSSLGYQDYIASSLDNIRGAGMKIAFIVQNFGKLKKLYGDEMESFFTNSGLELYFGKIGQIASEYLRKELGETEVVRLARNINRSENESTTETESTSFGSTKTEGGSENESDTTGKGTTQSESFGWSSGVNWSDSKNWGETNGTSMGRNYGPHIFFEPWTHTNSYGSNVNKNSGGSRGSGGNRGKTGQKTTGTSTNQSKTLSRGSTWSTATTETKTSGTSTSKGYQIGGGIAETFHAKPLLEPHEITSYLGALSDADIDHPAYPGMMLVRIHGEDPFFVRRSNYDQDPIFERTFSADPLHGFTTIEDQPLLGWQYLPENYLQAALPPVMEHLGYQLELNSSVQAGKRFTAQSDRQIFTLNEPKGGPSHTISMPGPAKVIHVDHDTSNPEVVLRTDKVIDPASFEKHLWKDHLAIANQRHIENETDMRERESEEREHFLRVSKLMQRRRELQNEIPALSRPQAPKVQEHFLKPIGIGLGAGFILSFIFGPLFLVAMGIGGYIGYQSWNKEKEAYDSAQELLRKRQNQLEGVKAELEKLR